MSVGDPQPVDAATRSCGSTTLASSLPIQQVPTGLYTVCEQLLIASSTVASSSFAATRVIGSKQDRPNQDGVALIRVRGGRRTNPHGFSAPK